MDTSRSNADNFTFNGTAEVLSKEEELCFCSHGEICYCCQVVASASSTPLLENAGSRERTPDMVNPSMQAIIPELVRNEFSSVEEMVESMSDEDDFCLCFHGEICLFCQVTASPMLTSFIETHAFIFANIDIGERTESEGESEVDMLDLSDQSRAFDQAAFEFNEHMIYGNDRFRARDPLLNICQHMYGAANSTCPDSKEHCCICLDEYIDGEVVAKIDCGHLYHVDCIKEWNKIENNCPMCKRRVSPMLP